MSTTKRLLATVAVISLFAAVPSAVLAHGGAQAKHGGVVQVAKDLSFELVAQGDGAAIYVEDHGKPMVPAGMAGKLTVLNGSAKTEAALAATGDKLVASGIKLDKGAKVVAALTTADRKAITVRFTVK